MAASTKWGSNHLKFRFFFVQDAGRGPLPLTQDGLAGGTELFGSVFGLTYNGEDQSTGTAIKRVGSGAFTVLSQAINSPTLGMADYQVSIADVTPDGLGPWNFVLEAYCTYADNSELVSDNIEGIQILPRLPSS